MEDILSAIFVSILMIPMFWCLNIFLIPLGHCSTSAVLFTYDVYQNLKNAPDEIALFSNGQSVFSVEYNQNGQETQCALYHGMLTWPQGYKSALLVRKMIKRQLIIRSIAMLFVIFAIMLITFFWVTEITRLDTIVQKGVSGVIFIIFSVMFISFQLNPIRLRLPFEKQIDIR